MTKVKKLLIVPALVVGLVVCGTATASDTYAGLTRPAALEKAKQGVIGLEIALNGISPAKAAKWRRWADAHPPRMSKSSCVNKGHRVKAWRVKWADSDPLFVNRSGLVCLSTG